MIKEFVQKHKIITLSVAAGIGVIFLALMGILYIQSEKKKLSEEKEAFVALERNKMQDELAELQAEYGLQVEKIRSGSGYGEQYMHLSSDSLLEQLGSERAKVERLAEELHSVKATDAKRIGQLSKEVQTLRKILKSYVSQVDSLQRINTQLQEENKQVRDNIATVEAEAQRLRTEKNSLTNQVARAARLDTRDIRCTALDKKGKKTNKIDRVRTIQIDLTLQKNVTAQPGSRTIYIRILNPNDQPVTAMGGAFTYEGSTLQATVSKVIEYGGEEMPITMYWNINETLLSGTYRVALFADGEIIGQTTIVL